MRNSEIAGTTALWVLFTFGLLATFIGAFALTKKLSSISMITGVKLFFMIGTCWLFAAFYFVKQVYVADICQQVSQTLQDKPPKYGTGISLYINCLNAVELYSLISTNYLQKEEQKALGIIQYEVQTSLVEALDVWKYYANVNNFVNLNLNLLQRTSGANTSLINAVNSVSEAGSISLDGNHSLYLLVYIEPHF